MVNTTGGSGRDPAIWPVAGEAETGDLLARLADALRACGGRLATAESCTGGLIAAACTALAGSSDWFDRGFVTYSNAAKTEQLGVPAGLIQAHGAVSEPVVRAMALGALRQSGATWAVAVTGIAGPGGGSPDKPVGTVWLGWAWWPHAGRQAVGAGPAVPQASDPPGPVTGPVIDAACMRFAGDRLDVRGATLAAALQGLLQRLAQPG